jgi:hypothetical protein
MPLKWPSVTAEQTFTLREHQSENTESDSNLRVGLKS